MEVLHRVTVVVVEIFSAERIGGRGRRFGRGLLIDLAEEGVNGSKPLLGAERLCTPFVVSRSLRARSARWITSAAGRRNKIPRAPSGLIS